MSTPNFYAVCGRYFVLELSEEEEELQDFVEDVENVIIEELGNKLYTVEEDKYDGDGLRDYEGHIFGSIRKYYTVYDKELQDYVDLDIYIPLIIRSGYYGDCNLDYKIYIYLDGEDVSDLSYSDYLTKTNAKRLNSFINRAVRAIEKVYKEYSTEYYCRAILSNGEAIYEKA